VFSALGGRKSDDRFATSHTSAWLLLDIFQRIIRRDDLTSARVVLNAAGDTREITGFDICRHLFHEHPPLAGCLVLCIMLSVTLLFFFAHHARLIVNNTTSNEMSKRSDTADACAEMHEADGSKLEAAALAAAAAAVAASATGATDTAAAPAVPSTPTTMLTTPPTTKGTTARIEVTTSATGVPAAVVPWEGVAHAVRLQYVWRNVYARCWQYNVAEVLWPLPANAACHDVQATNALKREH
jgi:hypothetical protein